MGQLDDRVILVTGAARGIGRACAILAAKEGARVVVNDLGGDVAGTDPGVAGPAEEVVAEIRSQGGVAVADSHSVADAHGAEAMVALALNRFGGLHGVINPAGILRDKMFHRMADADWQAVMDVHLNGSYHVARAAVQHFRDQEDGALVLFSSTSGLIGNIGQANYAAAKMGIVGLSRIIAMEGEMKKVRSNVIAPFAWTRMIATVPVKDEDGARRLDRIRTSMRADQVAPLAIALCSPGGSDVSGQIFAVRGNEVFIMSQPRPLRGIGRMEGWTSESLVTHAFPALRADMTDLGNSGSVFTWDPI